MAIWRTLIACWITKATNTHSEYVILIAFSLQQRLHERSSMLRSVYISCLVNPLNPELNPVCYLLALLAHHFLHVGRIMVKLLTLRLLMLYIYGAPILDVSRSHTTSQHSR